MAQGETPISDSVMEIQTHTRDPHYNGNEFDRSNVDVLPDLHSYDTKQEAQCINMSNHSNSGEHLDNADTVLHQRLEWKQTTPKKSTSNKDPQQYADKGHGIWSEQHQRRITRVPLKSEKTQKNRSILNDEVKVKDDHVPTEDGVQSPIRESPTDEMQPEQNGILGNPIEDQNKDNNLMEDDILSEGGNRLKNNPKHQENVSQNIEMQHDESNVFVAPDDRPLRKSEKPTEGETANLSTFVSEETCDQNRNMNTTDEQIKDPDGEEAKGHIKLKTLADLISVCRQKGLQIYNDVSHRPEQDKKLYSEADIAALDELGPPRGRKRHRRDDRSSKENVSTSRVDSRRRNTDEDDMASTSGFSVPRNRLGTAMSYATSYSNRTGTTRLESRLSYRSREERRLAYKDVDADEALQQRMWEKSKRRRKQKPNLLDVVKQKETSIGAAAAVLGQLRKIEDNCKVADANGKVSFDPDKLIYAQSNCSNDFVAGKETMETSKYINESEAKVIVTEAEVYDSQPNIADCAEYVADNGDVSNVNKDECSNGADAAICNGNKTSFDQQSESDSEKINNEDIGPDQNKDTDNLVETNDLNKDDNTDCDKDAATGDCNNDNLNTEGGDRTMNTVSDNDPHANASIDETEEHIIENANNSDNIDDHKTCDAENNVALNNSEEVGQHGRTTPISKSELNEEPHGLNIQSASLDDNETTLAQRANTDFRDATEIQEFRITDGTTTLILYRLKTDEIEDPKIREEILRESGAINNGNLLQDIQSLINDEPQSGSADRRRIEETVCSHDRSSVNSNTTTTQTDIGDTENEPQEIDTDNTDVQTEKSQPDHQNCDKEEEENPTTSSGNHSGLKESAMEVEKQRNKVKDLQRSENIRSNDSGIGSDSEKESLSKAENGEHLGKQKYKHAMQKSENMALAKLDTKNKASSTDEAKERQTNGSKVKRSLGNGFLVSSDGEDEDKTRGKTSTRFSNKQAGVSEMSKETRMVYLMEKIRQRYEEEKQTQTVYLQKISDTRRELKQEYHSLRHDDDYRQPPEPPAKPPAEPPIRDHPRKKVEPETKPEEKLVRKVITSKVDNNWSKDHPLYEQIKSGFKSTVKIPSTTRVQYVLKRMRDQRMSRSTSNLDSVYVEEAKRLHPNFFSREDLHYRDDKLESRTAAKSKVRHSVDKTGTEERHGKYTSRDMSPEKIMNEKDRTRPRSKSVNERPYRNRHDIRDIEKEALASIAHSRSKGYNKNVPRSKPAKFVKNDVEIEPKTLYERLQERTIANSQISHERDRNASGDPRKFESNSGPPSIRSFDTTSKDERPYRKRTKNHVTGNGAGSSLISGSLSSVHSTSTQTTSSEVPISLAVDIVKARNKFYSEPFGDEVTPRENRVCKLYRDLQHIRHRGNANPKHRGIGRSGNHVTDSLEAEGETPPFLLMNYEDFRTPIRQQKTDRELNKFLYGTLNYEICSKGRQLYAGPEKKEKALAILRQKVNKTALY